MTRAGQGSLFEQFAQLKAKLQAQGLFDASRKRTLPSLPRGIGLVTSHNAAALQDVAATLARRVPHLPVTFVPAAVQGAGAAEHIIAALRCLYAAAEKPVQDTAPIDVILLVRGGGSIDDLWSFNDEALAHVIAQSPVPLVCGVGHETDFTIADFVADLRAPTPTAAAELCALPRDQCLRHVSDQRSRLTVALERYGQQQQQRLDTCTQILSRPHVPLVQAHARLRDMHRRLTTLIQSTLVQYEHRLVLMQTGWTQCFEKMTHQRQQQLQHHAIRLQGLDPALVLERGYAWLQTPQGDALTSVSQMQVGQSVQAQLADGRVDLNVRRITSG